MQMFDVIPAVDVLGGKVVRLMHGDYSEVTRYGDDPVAQAQAFVSGGARLVHVVDLEGARTGHPDTALWQRLSEAGARFQIGGGIRTADRANAAIACGAARVVMGTAAVWAPEVLAGVGEIHKVVAAVDVRAGRATGGGWLDEGHEVGGVLDGLAEARVERVLVTGIETDGTMGGPDLSLLRRVVEDGRFAVIASGGVGSLDDIRTVAGLGCEAVIVGRALYEGRFTLEEALSAV